MSQVLINQDAVVTVAIMDSVSAPVTGLTSGDVSLYYRKEGGVATEKTLDAQTFSELDATNMPGLYEVTFGATELDTKGEFIGTLRQAGATAFETTYIRLEVVAQNLEGALSGLTQQISFIDDKTTSQITAGSSYSFPLRMTKEGVPVELAPSMVGATVIKGDGTIASKALDQNSWESLQGATGYHLLTLDSEDTGTSGELLIKLDPDAKASLANTPFNVSGEDIYLAEDGLAWAVVTNQITYDRTLIFSDDGGVSWIEDTGFTGSSLISITGDASNNVYVGGEDLELSRWDGSSWTIVSPADTGSDNWINGLALAGDGTLWIALRYTWTEGRIYSWDGTTLTLEHTNTGGAYNDIYVTENNVWAVGRNGIVTRGTFSGTWTWDEVGSSVDASNPTYLSVSFAPNNPDYGWVATDDYNKLHKTEDGGTTWEEVLLSGNYVDAYEVLVISPQEVYVATGGVGLQITEDGGTTWSIVVDPSDVSNASITTLTKVENTTLAGGNNYLAYLIESDFDAKELQVQVVPEQVPDYSSITYPLAEIKAESRSSSQVLNGSEYAVPVQITFEGEPAVGLTYSQVSLKVVKADKTVSSAPVSASQWEEIPEVPGLYMLTLSGDITDVEGELFVQIEGANGVLDITEALSATTFDGEVDYIADVHILNAGTQAVLGVKADNSAFYPLLSTDGGETFTDLVDPTTLFSTPTGTVSSKITVSSDGQVGLVTPAAGGSPNLHIYTEGGGWEALGSSYYDEDAEFVGVHVRETFGASDARAVYAASAFSATTIAAYNASGAEHEAFVSDRYGSLLMRDFDVIDFEISGTPHVWLVGVLSSAVGSGYVAVYDLGDLNSGAIPYRLTESFQFDPGQPPEGHKIVFDQVDATTLNLGLISFGTDGVRGTALHYTLNFPEDNPTWVEITNNLPVAAFDDIHVGPNQTIWIFDKDSGFYKSEDLGTTWESLGYLGAANTEGSSSFFQNDLALIETDTSSGSAALLDITGVPLVKPSFEAKTVQLQVVEEPAKPEVDNTTTQIVAGTPYALPIRYPGTTGLLEGEIDIFLAKSEGDASQVGVTPSQWESVAGVDGLYRYTLSSENTDTVGELLILLEPNFGSEVITDFPEGTPRLDDVYIDENGLGWACSPVSGWNELLRTEDGGRTWVIDPDFPGSLPRSIDGASGEAWVGSASNHRFYRWDGSTWTQVHNGSGFTGSHLETVHADPNFGIWAAGRVSTTSAIVFKWDEGLGGLVEIYTGSSRLSTIHASSSTEVWVGAATSPVIRQGVYDSGQDTWNFTDRSSEFPEIQAGFGNGIGAIEFLTEGVNPKQHGWIGNNNGVLYKTSDGGATWEHVASSPFVEDGVEIKSIIPISALEVWVVGSSFSSGTILSRTLDGGQSWLGRIPISGDANAANLNPEGNVVAVGGPNSSTGSISIAGAGYSTLPPKEIQIQIVEQGVVPSDIQVLGTGQNTLQTMLEDFINTQITYASSIPKDTSRTMLVKVLEEGQPVLGVPSSALSVVFHKSNGVITNPDLTSSWLEVDSVNLPGLYSFEIPETEANVEGDLGVVVELNLSDPFWAETSLDSPQNLNAVAFGEGQFGPVRTYAAGDSNTLYVSSDVGTTWTDVSSSLTAHGSNITSVVGIADTALAGVTTIGNDGEPKIFWGDPEQGSLSETQTGDLAGTGDLYDIENLYLEVGFSALAVGDGEIFTYSSGGKSDLTNTPNVPSGVIWRAVDAVSPGPSTSHYWAVGDAGNIVQITDNYGMVSAVDWSTNVGVAPTNLNDILSVSVGMSEFELWVVGDNGLVLKGDDGVNPTWETVDIGATENLVAIASIGTESLMIVGEGGTTYRTEDGGTTWEPFGTDGLVFTDVISPFTTEDVVATAGNHVYRFDDDPDVVTQTQTYRYTITDEAAVDLTPVTTALNEIKGATFDQSTDALDALRDSVDGVAGSIDFSTVEASLDDIKGVGFTTGDHSLVAIKNAVTAGGVDLTPVLDAIDEIKGTTFDASTDALDVLREAVDGVASSIDFTALETALDEIKGAGFDTSTDALKPLREAINSFETQTGQTLQDALNDIAEIRGMAARILGLSQENIRITGQQYDVNNNLVGSTLSVYESAQDVVSQTNPLATYQLTASYNSDNRLVDYRIVRTA